jgi:replication-associated recombination protein RarA
MIRMLNRLGPAVNSGRGMFLFGEPGNGKTSIAERITDAFGSSVWIPRAIAIEGEIMRIFDPAVHDEVSEMRARSSGLLDSMEY